jgi:threonine dehydrogenase-like Zn-dependent dehydrogenase
MRAVRNTEDGIRVLDVPEPEGDGVTVHVRSASICGTDLHVVGHWGPMPNTLGHEFAGTLDDGTPVAVDPGRSCGDCDQCRAGRTHLCRTGSDAVLGLIADGGMADRALVHARALVPLGARLRPEDACLVEPMAVAVHSLRVANVDGGTRVGVVGAGAVGLAVVAAAAATGCEVGVVARYDTQRVAAERLGAHGPAEGEYDVAIEAAGSDTALARAVELARPHGTVVTLTSLFHPLTITGFDVSMKELSLRWSYSYGTHVGGRDLDTAAALLDRTPDIVATMITHRFPLEDAAEAFRVAADRAHGAIKVVVQP